jgi:hypothetical protein
MLTGGQKYRHNEDDYDGNDNDNKLLLETDDINEDHHDDR